MRTKLLLVLGVPFAVCGVLLGISLVSRSISGRAYGTALSWSHHASAIRKVEARAIAYIAALDAGRDSRSIEEAGHELELASSASLELARQFSEEERQEEAELSEAVLELLERGTHAVRQSDRAALEGVREFYRDDVAAKIERRVEEEERGSLETARRGERVSARTLLAGTLGALLTLLLGLFLCVAVAQTITRSLSYLQDETKRVAAGDLRGVIALPDRDDLGELAQALNTMTRNLRETMVRKDDLAVLVQARTAQLSQSQLKLEENMEALRRAKIEIENQERRLADLFRSLGEALFVISREGIIVTANPASHVLLGYQALGLIGTKCREVMGDEARVEVLWARASESEKEEEEESELHTRGGGTVPVRLSLSLLRNSLGDPEGLICVAKDLTERQVLEGRLRQADKLSAIGQLAAGVAHEINNPLAVILGFAQGLERRLPEGDPHRMPVASIAREALRCKALVQELLTFSRTAKTTTEPVELNDLIRSTGVLIESRARTQNVRLVFDLGEDVGVLDANRTQIQQVLVNMGTNAMDAMTGGGTLTYRTRRDDEHAVCLEVTDTGSGIPEELISRVFDPFFTTKDAGKGTGLGLSLAHEIVHRHHGTIDIDSQLGRGTTMKIRLPTKLEGVARP